MQLNRLYGGLGRRGVSGPVPEAVSILSRLISWHEFDDALTDSAGPYPLTQNVSGVTYANASTGGSGPSGRVASAGYAASRPNYPTTLNAVDHCFFALVSTSAFSASAIIAGLGGPGSQFTQTVRENNSGGNTLGQYVVSDPGSIYYNGSTTSADTWKLLVSEFDAGTGVNQHVNNTLNAASSAFAQNLKAIDTINLGEASGGFGTNALVAFMGVIEGRMSQQELDYLYNGGSYRSFADIYEDAGSPAPTLVWDDVLTLARLNTSWDGTRTAVSVATGTDCQLITDSVYSTGKRYLEFNRPAAYTVANYTILGLLNVGITDGGHLNIDGAAGTVSAGVNFTVGTSPAAVMGSMSATDRGMMYIDFDAKKIWFGKNNTWSGDPVAGTGHALSYTTAGNMGIRIGSNREATSLKFFVTADTIAYTPPNSAAAWAD